MPVTHRIDPKQRLVHVTWVDPVTARDWTAALEAVLADAAYQPDFNFVADRRGAGAPDPAIARHIVDFVVARRHQFGRRIRVALLVTAPAAFGMARMQQIFNERAGVESRIFGDERAALGWLSAQPASEARDP